MVGTAHAYSIQLHLGSCPHHVWWLMVAEISTRPGPEAYMQTLHVAWASSRCVGCVPGQMSQERDGQ